MCISPHTYTISTNLENTKDIKGYTVESIDTLDELKTFYIEGLRENSEITQHEIPVVFKNDCQLRVICCDVDITKHIEYLEMYISLKTILKS